MYDNKIYGRRKTKNLTERQEWLYEHLFPSVSISSMADISNITCSFEKVNIEIGFGKGEHLSSLAKKNPEQLFIGCESFINGVASLLLKIDQNGIKNILIFQEDARKIIKDSDDSLFNTVFLLFPDPWRKRRHHKRRFFQVENIKDIHRSMKIGGELRVATDHIDYAESMLKIISQPEISNIFTATVWSGGNRPNGEDWPITRYEQKSKNDILFTKLEKTNT